MTREQAEDTIEGLQELISRGLQSVYLDMALAGMRQLLAAMDSEPVGWTDEAELRDVKKDGCGYLFKANPITPHADPRRVILLYRHAQPAPVVPPKQHWEELCREYPDMSIGDAIIRAAWWNHCRAAMLQAGNSPVIGIDLASGPYRTVEVRYVAPSGYVMVPKEPSEAMINAWLSEVANWRGHVAGYKAMLAAAPQEVKGE